MKPRKKLERRTSNLPRTNKTAEDFIRWLREQDTHKNQVAEAQSARDHLQALMVWADDGGVVG